MDAQPRQLLTDGQRETLCKLIRSLRRDGQHPWDMPGITAAVIELEQRAATTAQVCATATTAAAMTEYRTPAMMWRPGRHWPPDGDADGQRGAPMRARTRVGCPDHPGEELHRCPACAAETRPAHVEEVEAMRAAAAQGRAVQAEIEARHAGRRL